MGSLSETLSKIILIPYPKEECKNVSDDIVQNLKVVQ